MTKSALSSSLETNATPFPYRLARRYRGSTCRLTHSQCRFRRNTMWKLLFAIACFVGSTFAGYRHADTNNIPECLLECYKTPVPLLPMTMGTFIDLLRKVESYQLTMDLRMQTNDILSRFWRDGIVRDPNVAKVVPNVLSYSGSGMQYYKFALLRVLIPLTENPLFPDEALNLIERCTLHRMLSSGMEVWERGDEYTVCPLAEPQHQETSVQLTGAKKSSCPVELGVVKSVYGTLSPNHLLLAIASALQPMQVNQRTILSSTTKRPSKLYFAYNKTIDNFWASTIAGDMAELLVLQVPISAHPIYGPSGFWNDSQIPILFYQKTNYEGVLNDFWQDTDAELLAGVDGVMIGRNLASLTTFTWSLRLSQVLEMFYSARAGQFPNQLRACDRREFFVETLLYSRGILEQQMVNFAELLTCNSINFILDASFIETNRERTFNEYKDYVTKLVGNFPRCADVPKYSESKVRLTVIYDATWDPYTTLQVLMYGSHYWLCIVLTAICASANVTLTNYTDFSKPSCSAAKLNSGKIWRISEIINVSHYGSSVTVINGVTGFRVVSNANTIGDIYLQWRTTSNSAKEVRSTDLTNGFLALKTHVESKEFRTKRSDPAADVTLILAKNSYLTDVSSEQITSTLKSIKSETADMRFVYVIRTSDSRPWVRLTSLPFSQDDRIITIDDNNLETLYTKLAILEDIPRFIVPPQCENNLHDTDPLFSIEQYLTPGSALFYMVHPVHFCSSSYVFIVIENFHYGDVTICQSREPIDQSKDSRCVNVSKLEKFRFRLDNPCASRTITGPLETWDRNCRPIYMKVSAIESTKRCTERDCRFIDQIKFNFNVGGIDCIDEFAVPCSAVSRFSNVVLIILLLLLSRQQ